MFQVGEAGREKVPMSMSEGNMLQQQMKRRKRVNRIKKAVISLVAIWMSVLTFLCVGLYMKVNELESHIDEIAKSLPQAEQVQNTETKNQPKAEEGGSVKNDVEDTEEQPDAKDEAKSIAQAEPQVGNVTVNDQSDNLADATETQKVYLTFDDGPSENTAKILDILKKYNIKATFFVIGKTDEVSKAMYQRIVAEGHTLGMHSWSHKYSVLYDSLDAFEQDYEQIHDYLYEITGVDCKYYRFPGGSSNRVSNCDMSQFINCLNEKGVTYFDWNVSSGDATSQAYTVDELIQNVMKDVLKYKTSVVLMHDSTVKPTTVEALAPLIEKLQASGATILPIDGNTTPVQHVVISAQ